MYKFKFIKRWFLKIPKNQRLEKMLVGTKCPNCNDSFLNTFSLENNQEECSKCGFSQFTTLKEFLF